MKDFNVERVTNEIIEFIRDYYKKNNLKGAVIGISGGKDSGVVAGLFVKALGGENVHGVWLPCHSKDEDKLNAIKVANHFGFTLTEFDLTETYDNYVQQIKDLYVVQDDCLVDANINIKPRLRTATLYYHAAMLSALNKGVYIVPGTSNKCEIHVGYFTKGGDNVADIQVLADLTVDEVIAIGEVLNVPKEVLYRIPSDGLSGLSDEDKLGFTYDELDRYIFTGECDDPDKKKKIDHLHEINLHKLKTISMFKKQ